MVNNLINLITTDKYFFDISSVRNNQTRSACLETYHLPRLTTFLDQLSSKYIGPKVLSNIFENLESLSPYLFGKQYRNVLLSSEKSCGFSFHMLSIFL